MHKRCTGPISFPFPRPLFSSLAHTRTRTHARTDGRTDDARTHARTERQTHCVKKPLEKERGLVVAVEKSLDRD